jgi:voltage-gated potassium channel
MASAKSSELKNTTYEAFIGVLSILSIVNIALIYLARSEHVEDVIYIMSGIMSLIFLGDFAYRMLTTDSKSRYFFREFGWADLLACVPIPQLKILRAFRLFRAYRLGKAYGVKNMIRNFWAQRAQSALIAVGLFIMLLLEFGGMAIVWAEEGKDGANITSGSDGVWWAYVTITTVGYGDQFPVSNIGRAIGVLVMTGGVALFGVLTGFLANVFLSPAKEDEEEVPAGKNARALLVNLRRMVEQQEEATARLKARISELEAIL